jgi:hypothetical protein
MPLARINELNRLAKAHFEGDQEIRLRLETTLNPGSPLARAA